ncbi:MAG: DEAD/DEAH box helicase [Patescibacteria group bacterium]
MQQSSSFYGLGIAPQLLETLDKLNFKIPTPIQQQAIPHAIEGKDVMGIAQTGTGKTLAFGVPMIQRLASTGGMGLVVLPTRELAVQVDETLRKLTQKGTAVLIGGTSQERQVQALRRNPRIIIGTPGRINDLLQQKLLRLDQVKVLVLDEADRMFDMGFAPQIKKILQVIPPDRQTMLFSATMPTEIVRLASGYMKLPIRVEIARAGTAAETVIQELYVVPHNDKLRLLEKLLTEYHGTVLIFSRTKHGAKKICRAIRTMGHNAAELHSNLSFSQRTRSMEGFRSGAFRILVATDIAARGIDVSSIELVINYDVPEHAEDYVHRIGRTGRAGAEGRAITFASPDQAREVRDIQKLIRTWIPIAKLPELPPARILPQVSKNPVARGQRGFSRRRY